MLLSQCRDNSSRVSLSRLRRDCGGGGVNDSNDVGTTIATTAVAAAGVVIVFVVAVAVVGVGMVAMVSAQTTGWLVAKWGAS